MQVGGRGYKTRPVTLELILQQRWPASCSNQTFQPSLILIVTNQQIEAHFCTLKKSQLTASLIPSLHTSLVSTRRATANETIGAPFKRRDGHDGTLGNVELLDDELVEHLLDVLDGHAALRVLLVREHERRHAVNAVVRYDGLCKAKTTLAGSRLQETGKCFRRRVVAAQTVAPALRTSVRHLGSTHPKLRGIHPLPPRKFLDLTDSPKTFQHSSRRSLSVESITKHSAWHSL